MVCRELFSSDSTVLYSCVGQRKNQPRLKEFPGRKSARICQSLALFGSQLNYRRTGSHTNPGMPGLDGYTIIETVHSEVSS